MNEETKNYGLDLEREEQDRTDEDWIFGAKPLIGLSDKVAGLVIVLFAWPQPKDGVYPRVTNKFNHVVCFFNRKWKQYFSKGEVQKAAEDFMDCVSRGHNEEIEKQLNYLLQNDLLSHENTQWLKNNGYTVEGGKVELSDRFPAILSNTTRNGNSVKAPIEAIRKFGCIPKSMLPKKAWFMWNDYHKKSDIILEMYDLGLEFKKRILINYEIVYDKDFHKFSGDIKYEIRDSYIDPADGDFEKRLAPNYKLMSYGYRIIINEIPQKPEPQEEEEIMEFYKASESEHPERIYQKGVDEKYHWITDEPVFKGLYGDFDKVQINDLVTIGEDRIGFAVTSQQTLIEIISNLFKGKK